MSNYVKRLVQEVSDYGDAGDYEARPGGSKDPQRQSLSKLALNHMKFSGSRPGETVLPGEEEDDGTSVPIKHLPPKPAAPPVAKPGAGKYGGRWGLKFGEHNGAQLAARLIG